MLDCRDVAQRPVARDVPRCWFICEAPARATLSDLSGAGWATGEMLGTLFSFEFPLGSKGI